MEPFEIPGFRSLNEVLLRMAGFLIQVYFAYLSGFSDFIIETGARIENLTD